LKEDIMARITLITDDCKRKVSPLCSGTFTFERKPGRPPITCPACREFKAANAPKPKATAKPSEKASKRPESVTCGCGKVFPVTNSRGALPKRCTECREAKLTWRADDEGNVKLIQADQIRREQQEFSNKVSRERAMLLQGMMEKLNKKTDRKVIVH
jgi:hypothetical protein